MHRGSSKGPRGRAPGPGPLPLSAPRTVQIRFAVERAGRSERHTVRVPAGTPLRVVLRTIGQPAEGCAVLSDGRSVPLDLPLDADVRLTVIPTFSGG